ncbi:MAG: hypothetical protein ACOCUD_03830 [Bacillota bacterium]
MKLAEAIGSDDFKNMLKDFMPKEAYKRIEITKMGSVGDDEELKNLIDTFIKNNRKQIMKKQCFRNAALLTSLHDDIDYVEGFTGIDLGGSILPIEHAWNVWKDKLHFDITSEIEFGGDIGKGSKNYAKLVVIKSPTKATKLASDVLRASQQIARGKL